MMIRIYKDLLISIFLGFLAFLFILIITGDHEFARTVWLVGINFHVLSTRIFNLEQKIRKLERLLGWDIEVNERNKNE